MYRILYKGHMIHTDLTAEECGEIIQDLSERFFSGEDIDPNEIEMEEI